MTARYGDAGSASLFVVFGAALLVALLTSLTATFAAVSARARARSAADLAALAAASHDCDAAAHVARANRAFLRSCVVTGGIADVTVTVRLGGAWASFGAAGARARAG